MVVQRLTIDGWRASRATVDAFNLFLIDFPSPPDVKVECIGRRLRFNMTLYERGATQHHTTYEVPTR